MARLVQFAPEQAGITLSLNASALYLGSASGAALGAVVLSAGRAADLGWIGAVCTVAALGLLACRRGKRGDYAGGAAGGMTITGTDRLNLPENRSFRLARILVSLSFRACGRRVLQSIFAL